MEYYLAIKKKEIILFLATWIDLEIIIPSEVSQKKKKTNLSYDIMYQYLYKGMEILTNITMVIIFQHPFQIITLYMFFKNVYLFIFSCIRCCSM